MDSCETEVWLRSQFEKFQHSSGLALLRFSVKEETIKAVRTETKRTDCARGRTVKVEKLKN